MEDKRLQENKKLRERLDKLLNEARRNEKTQTSFDDFALSIVAAQGPAELFQLLLEQKKKFHIDKIRICLIDRYHEIERLLTNNYQDSYPGLSFIDVETSKKLISDLPNNPVLGTRIVNKYDWLINIDESNEYKSAALLPLKRGSKIIGIQLLLSKDATRYDKSDGTTFLHKLAAMIAISIENCINRQRILDMGYHDGLTNAYNRRYFDERLKNEVDRCVRNKTDLVCLFIDVDFFKRVNDVHGHQVGDAVLVRLVTLMQDLVRSSDVVARYGGEEFTVILPDTGIQLAREVAERIRSQVAKQALIIDGDTLSITVSIGLASLSQIKFQKADAKNKSLQNNTDDLDQLLLSKADEALYQAKQTGRNQVVIKKMVN
ncbi:MAG: sensor domain-containing diguanylate cyclase [Gammaproteobacteria bacterium]|nr:sensor domain-containing diguanylate cyclase [Gammaproteobacteria bacterium]